MRECKMIGCPFNNIYIEMDKTDNNIHVVKRSIRYCACPARSDNDCLRCGV